MLILCISRKNRMAAIESLFWTINRKWQLFHGMFDKSSSLTSLINSSELKQESLQSGTADGIIMAHLQMPRDIRIDIEPDHDYRGRGLMRYQEARPRHAEFEGGPGPFQQLFNMEEILQGARPREQPQQINS